MSKAIFSGMIGTKRQTVFYTIVTMVIFALLSLACTVSMPKQSLQGQEQQTAQKALDIAIAEAAARIDEHIEAGTKIALLNFNSPSDRFSAYVLDELTANLVDSRNLTIVARKEIDLIRSEFEFQYSGQVEDESMQALGRMLGAQSIVSGSLTPIGRSYRIVIRVLNVQTATVAVQYRTDIVSDDRVQALLEVGKSGGATTNGSRQQVTQAARQVSQTTATSQSIGSKSSSFTDPRNGQTYRTVKIGNKTWMAENLNFRPRTDDTWCYDHDDSNCEKYGRLYTQDAAMKACPEGWRLPSRKDWNDLVWEADGKDAAGERLKSKTGWNNNGNGSDKFGFSALPGGHRFFNGGFSNIGNNGFWWSATAYLDAYCMDMRHNSDNIRLSDINNKSFGLSVRCIQND